MNLPINNPKNIEPTKVKDEKFKKASEEIDGPGHKPVIPQPIPNNNEPIIRGLSIFFLVGKCIFLAKTIESLFVKKKRIGAVIVMAPAITKPKEGSQLKKISRKPITLSGLVMLERVRPIPNITPLISTRVFLIIQSTQIFA